MKKKFFLFSLCSMMIFVAAAQNVGIGTSTPLARLHVTDSAVLLSGAVSIPPFTTTINPPMQGAGTRMMWFPALGAIRAGYVDGTQWNRDSIGSLSFAIGQNTMAKGSHAVAMGLGSVASGNYSRAMGNGAVASGNYSTSIGYLTTASGSNASIAMGWGSQATAHVSTALGFNSIASGEFSTSIGNGTQSLGHSAFSTGIGTVASGVYSSAAGAFTEASGRGATAVGNFTNAGGYYSFASGDSTFAKAKHSFTAGVFNDNTDNPLINVAALSDRIFQIGNGTNNTTRSNALTIFRNGNTGFGNTDPAYRLDVSGRMRIRSGGDLNNSAGIFLNNTNNSDIPAFIGMQSNNHVGFYGNISGWSFVMNTTNGNVGMGTSTPTTKLEVNGFTKLGSDAPAIKVKKLTGTTSAIQGGTVNISHDVTFSKIISVSVLVESQTGNYTPPSFTYLPGYEYNFDILNDKVWIFNNDGNAGNILAKSFKVLITYEE